MFSNKIIKIAGFLCVILSLNVIADEGRHHVSIDMTGGVYILSPSNSDNSTSIGYMISPDINYSIPCQLPVLCRNGSRYFISFMWTGVEALSAGGGTEDTNQNSSTPAKPINTQEYNGMIGISYDFDLSKGAVTSAADKFFIGIGYGNVLVENEKVLEGITMMVGFKLTVLAFDLVK